VELRQYTLVPGTASSFVELFERELVDTQEAAGMRLLGTFTDLDDPDRFVWLRGFADMTARHAALTAFYTGPAWRAHRDRANGMMLDSDNVRLLQPVAGLPALDGATTHSAGRVTIVIEPAGGAGPLAAEGVPGLLGVFKTVPLENDFPALPVIEGESVRVLVLRGTDRRIDGAATALRLRATPRSALR
jgi:quinol monooxygenase YgiN